MEVGGEVEENREMERRGERDYDASARLAASLPTPQLTFIGSPAGLNTLTSAPSLSKIRAASNAVSLEKELQERAISLSSTAVPWRDSPLPQAPVQHEQLNFLLPTLR